MKYDETEIDYIKEQFCRYKCQMSSYIKSLEESNPYLDLEPKYHCKICQLDNFIKEMRDYKII